MGAEKYPGLRANVISMYKSHFQKEGFLRPKIIENHKISGKVKKEHSVDIYFEFVQMNNLERTIIKTIEGKELTEEDVWEFAYVLKDLRFLAKGIIYYDEEVSNDAKKAANMANIDLKKFIFFNEIKKSVLGLLQIMLPGDDVVGDPFWVIMTTVKNKVDENTGCYNMINDKIILFLSKKQADIYCRKLKSNSKVFGISHKHLTVLISLQEKKLFLDFCIAFPEFKQTNESSIDCYNISHEKFRKIYLRGDTYE